MTLDEARRRIGEDVAYRAHATAPLEKGTIASVGEAYVFVRYGGDAGAKATRAEDLVPW